MPAVRCPSVPRRIDVELTSAREDGSFTWRAAGAKQPKGVVGGSLLYGGAKVGDVVRAEADFDVEGISIVSVVPPPQAAARAEAARIEIVGTGREAPGVTSSALSRERGRADGEHQGGRPERSGPRSDRGDRPGGSGGPRGADRGDRRGPRPERSDRPERGSRPDRSERAAPAEGASRPERAPRPTGADRTRPKRLSPASTHRDAYLATLVPEQQVVAELLLRGGIPAVRAAVSQQNQNRPEGAPAIDADPLVNLAENMLPAVRQAEWRDRAEAAKAALDEVGLRDLRAIVTAGDASARDETSKALAAELRDGLERRTRADRETWIAEITSCLADGKVVRALRLSSRPPDPSTKVPADLLEQLRKCANAALGPETPQDRWAALLEAVIASPVRRSVEPTGLPPQAGPALQLAARQAAGRIPALAALLGVDLPPPPGLRAAPGRGGRAAPPPPPRPPAAPAITQDEVPIEPPSAEDATAPAGVPEMVADEPEVAADGRPEPLDDEDDDSDGAPVGQPDIAASPADL